MAGELVSPTPALRGSARRTAALRLLRRRLIQAVPLMLGVVIINFCLIQMAPGSFLELMTAENQVSDPATVALLRKTYGLDDPVWMQLLKYIWALLHFDFGFSYRQNMPVIQAIWIHLPATVLLMVSSIALAISIGVAAGVVASMKVRTFWDSLVSVAAMFFYAAPSFWLGIMMIVLFSVKLGWLPASGYVSPREDLMQSLATTIMPAFVLGNAIAAVLMRHTRSAMLQVLGQDYVRTARAKGLAEKVVVVKHALRNAAVPIVTLGALEFGQLLSGAVLTEQVFTIPGFGKLIVDAVFNRDYLVVQGVVLVTATVYVSLNLLADVAYILLNPRLR